jgi:hypothetical protein
VFVIEADLSKDYGKLELLGHLDNDTGPFATTEIVNGQEYKPSSIVSGSVSAWLGAGYRRFVATFQADNGFGTKLIAEGGYLYSNRTNDTGRGVQPFATRRFTA